MFVISGEYKKQYQKIRKYIKRHARNNQKRNDVLKDIHALFIDLEVNQKSLEAFTDYKAYANELMVNLEVKPYRRLNKYVLAVCLLSTVIASAVLWYQHEMSKYLTLNVPQVSIQTNSNILMWTPVTNADYYNIYFDGVFVTKTTHTSYDIPNPGYSESFNVVIEAKSDNKYNLASKSQTTLITTKKKVANLYDIATGPVMAYFDRYGNAFVSTSVDFTGRYVINIYDAYAHDIVVIDKTTDEEIMVDTSENIKSVYLERLHYYEFKITQTINEYSIYFSLDAYETRTTLDQETFTLEPKQEILIRYDNPTEIRQYYRLTELNSSIMMNTYTGISKENRDIFNSNYNNTIRFREAQLSTYLVISNFADNAQTITLESFTDQVIKLEEDTPIVIADTELTQIFTFDHYGSFEFIYTYGVRDHNMQFYNSNGENLISFCSTTQSSKTCHIYFSGIVHVVFSKTTIETNSVGVSTLEVKRT